jgi:predicted nucleic acid-binding protein
MNSLVLDSCALVKLVWTEPDADLVERIAHRVFTQGGQIVVLDFALVECAQTLWKLFHRKLMEAGQVINLLSQLQSFPLVHMPSLPLLADATALAVAYDRSVYDMLFVSLTKKLNVIGVTADNALVNAVGGFEKQIKLISDPTLG